MSTPDYNTSFSDATGLSDIDNNGKSTTPLSVDDTSVIKPDVPGFRDYVPSATRRKLAEVQRAEHQDAKVNRDRNIHIPASGVLMGPPDYLSGTDSESIREERKKEIMKIAKQIRKDRKKQWADYKEAEELLESIKRDPEMGSLISNDPKMRRAAAIVKAGKPASIGKDACIEAARNKVLGLSN